MNIKQKELVAQLYSFLKDRFPEIQFIKVIESPESTNSLWVEIAPPIDEDREIELLEIASEKEMDILEEYGYQIMLMPTGTLIND